VWCERVLYNSASMPSRATAVREVDFVDLEWHECKRLLKKRSRGGRDMRVLLPPDQRLRHGDILYEDATVILSINVRPMELIVAGPASTRRLLELALELGNLHWPTQVISDRILFPEHPTAMTVIERLNIAWSKETRRFEPTELIAAPSAELSGDVQVVRRSPSRSSAISA
jgi:urease accessory protein UreE